MNLRYTMLVLATLALPGITRADAPAAASLLSNGNFEAASKSSDWPDGWPHPEGASWEAEGGNHFLRLRPAKPDHTLTIFRSVAVKPEHKAYALAFRVRYADLKRGKANWHDGRIVLDFKDAAGRKLKGSPGAPSFKGTSDGWVDRRVEFLVPEGAATLDVMPALFLVESGTLDLDDFQLTPIPAEPLVAAAEAAKVKEAARIAALPKPVPQVPVPPADKLPKELRVDGNQIKNAAGETVWLQGLSVPSLEWSAKGDNVLKSIDVALKEWKANCIRLPIRENFWSGHGPYQKDGGMGYRQTVDDAVNACAGGGAYIVLDLHRFRAPDEDHVAFWREIAARYKNHPAVLFELFNEPHDISWEVWRDGGAVTDKKEPKPAKGGPEVAEENKEELAGFKAVGMQRLVDVVRETGAKNIVIAGGLDWGYDLSGILNGFALNDRGGNGVVYSSHVYPWKSDWQGKFLAVAAKYPLFIGELGAEVERMPFIPPERHEDPYTWSPDMLGLIQKHKLHWTGWCFHPKSTPRVIADWDYTPTPFWGEFVKKALRGEKYEMKRMR